MEWYAVYMYDLNDGNQEIVFVEAVSDSMAESLAVEKTKTDSLGVAWEAQFCVKVPPEVNK